ASAGLGRVARWRPDQARVRPLLVSWATYSATRCRWWASPSARRTAEGGGGRGRGRPLARKSRGLLTGASGFRACEQADTAVNSRRGDGTPKAGAAGTRTGC